MVAAWLFGWTVPISGATGGAWLPSNPAMLLIPLAPQLRGVALPLGLATRAADLANLAAYAQGSIDEPGIDLGSLLFGLQHMDLLPVSQPTSPAEIRLALSADSVAITSSGGDIDPVLFLRSLSRSPTRAAIQQGALVPIWSKLIGSLRLDAGYIASVIPYEAIGDTSMIAILEGAPTVDGTRYGLDIRSVVDLSLAVRTTYGWRLPTAIGDIIPAFSVTVPVSIGHAEATIASWVETGSEAIPASFGTSWESVYWYPGAGVGIGARFDVGVAWRSSFGIVGVSATNLISGWFAAARRSTMATTDEPITIADVRFAPAALLSFVTRLQTGSAGYVILATQFGYRRNLVGAVRVVYSNGPLSLVAQAGFDRGTRIGFGVAAVVGRLYVEPSIEVRSDSVTGATIGGFMVSVAGTEKAGEKR